MGGDSRVTLGRIGAYAVLLGVLASIAAYGLIVFFTQLPIFADEDACITNQRIAEQLRDAQRGSTGGVVTSGISLFPPALECTFSSAEGPAITVRDGPDGWVYPVGGGLLVALAGSAALLGRAAARGSASGSSARSA